MLGQRAKNTTAKRRAAARAAAPQDVRAQILAAAVRTIEEGGLADVSMREVARRAGVSHQLPYHYFTDREGILAAIAEEGFTVLAERLRGALARDGSAADRLAAAGRAYVGFACEHPAHFRVMFRKDHVEIDRFPRAEQCAHGAFELLPKVIQDCITEGLPPEPNMTALVVLGWSLSHGLACLLLDGPLARKVPEAADGNEAITRDVMDAMKRMIEAASGKDRADRR